MDGNAPRWLAVLLIVFGTAVLGVSIYLERTHLELLQEHPIMVNLLSGMIGFGYSVVLVAFVINGVIRRSRIRSRRPRLYSMRSKAQDIHKELGYAIPADIRTRLGSDDIGPIMSSTNKVAGKPGKEIDLEEIARGTRFFLVEAGKFLERSTQVFELLVVPDDEIANQLTHVSDMLEGIRHWGRYERNPPAGDWRAKPRLDGSDIRQIVVSYSLAVGAIRKLWDLMFANPEIRRAGKPRGFSPPMLTAG